MNILYLGSIVFNCFLLWFVFSNNFVLGTSYFIVTLGILCLLFFDHLENVLLINGQNRSLKQASQKVVYQESSSLNSPKMGKVELSDLGSASFASNLGAYSPQQKIIFQSFEPKQGLAMYELENYSKRIYPHLKKLVICQFPKPHLEEPTLVDFLLGNTSLNLIRCNSFTYNVDLIPYAGPLKPSLRSKLLQFFSHQMSHYQAIVFLMEDKELKEWHSLSNPQTASIEPIFVDAGGSEAIRSTQLEPFPQSIEI